MLASFTSFTRWKSLAVDAPGRELPEQVRQLLPSRFEAVGEALVSGSDPAAACSVAGRAVARDGASLGEALDALRVTYTAVCGRVPDFSAAEALSVAWSEATLEYLHQLSCEDPLTGLASLAHIRTRLAEIYREADQAGTDVRATHALVIVETRGTPDADPDLHFTRALQLATVAEALRGVFSGGESTGRLGTHRAVAVVHRRLDLGRQVALLRSLLRDLDLDESQVRVWIEGLPAHAESLTRLLDELAR